MILVSTITATGVLMHSCKKDENAWDGYVAFYGADDLITAAPETPNPYDSDYLLLPNPGRDNLTIQSAREGVRLRMFNQVGDLVLERRLTDDFRNEINTSSLRPGVYLVSVHIVGSLSYNVQEQGLRSSEIQGVDFRQ